MTFGNRSATFKPLRLCFCAGLASLVSGALSTQANAQDPYEVPSFRKGMWHFVRTLRFQEQAAAAGTGNDALR